MQEVLRHATQAHTVGLPGHPSKTLYGPVDIGITATYHKHTLNIDSKL